MKTRNTILITMTALFFAGCSLYPVPDDPRSLLSLLNSLQGNGSSGTINANNSTFCWDHSRLYTDSGASLNDGERSAFADMDGDGDQDLFICGENGSAFAAYIYRNDGTGNFTRVDTAVGGLNESHILVEDLDGDGDQDALMIGDENGTTFRAVLYRNRLN